jgi:chromosome segregation ATPase
MHDTSTPSASDPRLAKPSDSIAELLRGVYRDSEQHALRLQQLTQELRTLREEQARQASTTELRLQESHEQRTGNEALRLTLVEQGQQLQRWRTEAQQRMELLDRRLAHLEEEQRFDRARLSELRADIEGAQDRGMRSNLMAQQARNFGLRAILLSSLALLAALTVAGLGLWPNLRTWLH